MRRSATAAGIYSATAFGFLGQLLAARTLGPSAYGLLAIVLASTGFFQSLLDLTVEEALIKYGFHYTTGGDWGKLRRLFVRALQFKVAGGLLAAVALLALAPFAGGVFGAGGLVAPMLLAAAIPAAQAPEALAAAAIMLRGRYDVRAWFLSVSMALRLAGLAVGSRYGVGEAVLGMVAAQVVATAAVSVAGLVAFRRFPRAEAGSIRSERRSILNFVFQSSLATSVLSMRGMLGPILLGIVTSPIQVGFFRTALAPQQGFASLSAPARLILLAEQTRDWEAGKVGVVFAGVRRYTLGALLLMVVLLPPLLVFMPDLIRILYTSRFLPATDAARLIVLAAGLQLVVGWTKSLPVSVGRPGLRVLTHGIEALVFVPLVVVLGALWHATGAAGAVLASTAAFVAVWTVVLARLKRGAAEPVVTGSAPA